MKVLPPVVRRGIVAFTRDVFARESVERRWELPAQSAPVSLHMVLGRRTLLMAALALRSWEFYTGMRWAPFLHEDGTFSDDDEREALRLFPDATVIRRDRADREVQEALLGHPVCHENRMKHHWFLKNFDTRHYAPHDRYIVMDSDIVFFRRPDFILRWIERRDETFWFMEDTNEKYASPRPDLEAALGVQLWQKVNSGLDLMFRPGFPLDLAETFLSRCASTARHFQFLEQSLFGVVGSVWGKGGLLPAEYEISWGNFRRPGAVCRHYVADFKNDVLFVEGGTNFWLKGRSHG